MSVMDAARWRRASGYLDRLLDLPEAERETCLTSIRAEDPDAATDLDTLLGAHRRLSAARFLDDAPALPLVEPALRGLTLGAYTLETPIGSGGMGSVWRASRSDGRFEGRVALKLLNAALVGRGGEARFRREGTILARLTHPHIARLIDAGVSDTGQPYLVLEFIDGRHFDAYCDEERLDVRARVRLFLDVLAAVSHAHASLIVHRDLKPSNVLVTREGQVKLLDFSIAKLIEDEEGPAATRLTREAASVLTPRYAAPEQVMGGPITTATDVYALGVLLYESLTGRHPAGLADDAPPSLFRAVIEADPARASAAAFEAATRDPGMAAARSTTAERLRRALLGDLDTILAKALKKAPAERYASVAAFADDLHRYLDEQPIAARPDALAYRAAKFARRHRRSLAAGAAAAAMLASLLALHTMQLATERDRARLEAEKAARVSELLTGLLAGADPYRTPDAKEPTVQNLLDRGAERVASELGDQPEVQAELYTVIGRTYQRMGLYDKAQPLLEQALAIGRRTFGAEDVRVAQSLNELGVLLRERGSLAAAEPLLAESLALRRRLLPETNDLAIALVEYSRVLQDRGRTTEAEAPAREALEIRRRVLGDEHRETATSKSELALLLAARGDLAGAEPLFRESVETTERLLGPIHPNVAASKSNLARTLAARGDAVAAEALFRQAVDIDRGVFGEAHVEYALALNGLAGAVELQGRLDEAAALLDEASRIVRPQLGDDHSRTATIGLNLARVRLAQRRAAEAEPALRHALSVRQRTLPPGDWRIAQAQSLLGAALAAQGRAGEAEPLMRAAATGLAAVPGTQDRERRANLARLAALNDSRQPPARPARAR